MTEHGHDLPGRATGLCQTPSGCFAEPVRLAFEREFGRSDGVTHKLTEAVDRKRLSLFGRDNDEMLAIDRS